MKVRLRLSRERGLDLLVLVSFIAVSLAFCYPLPFRLATEVAGRYVDTRVFQWNNWWLKYALFNGLDPDYSHYIYYPSGASLVSHNMNWVSATLAIPLDLLFGPIVAYNLTFLLTFWLSGYGMYALARHVTGHRGAAFVAGLAFAFSPYHVSGNFDGQMNLANVQWIPLCALFMLRVVSDRRWQDAVWAGVFGALASLDCWFFAIFLGLWSALFVAYLLIAAWKRLSWWTAGLLCLAGGVALGLIAPFLWPVLAEMDSGEVGEVLDYFAVDKSSDLLAFFTPSSDHPLTGNRDAPVYARFAHWRPAYLGISALALALYAVVVTRRRAMLWALSLVFFVLLALGPVLEVGGVSYPGIPMLLAWLIRWVPAFKIIRQASRFNVMVSFSLAVLVGLACADLYARLCKARPGRAGVRAGGGALVAIGAVVLFEYLALPCPLSTARVSPFYHALAQQEGDLALLELPIDDFHSREYLYPQTIHHKKLVNGYVARTPDSAQSFIEHQPLLRKLQIQMEVDPTLHDIPAAMDVLAANNVRYVVVHKQPLPPQPPVDEGVFALWHELFGPDTAYADDEISVYRLPAPVQRARIADLHGGLAVSGIRTRRVWLPSGQFLSVRVTWEAQRDLVQDLALHMSLTGPGGAVARSRVEAIAPKYPTSRWPDGVVVEDEMLIPIDASLPAGDYVLALTVVDAVSQVERGSLTHDVHVGREALPFVPALQEMAVPAGVTYGDEMQLLGYTPRQQGGQLAIELYWLALRAMETDYKVFVHLVNPVDQSIAAQVDTMPRNWSYPTSRWGRREVYVDRIALDLSGVAPGAYRLAVGVYAPEADRLSATDVHGRPVLDGRAILEQAIEVESW